MCECGADPCGESSASTRRRRCPTGQKRRAITLGLPAEQRWNSPLSTERPDLPASDVEVDFSDSLQDSARERMVLEALPRPGSTRGHSWAHRYGWRSRQTLGCEAEPGIRVWRLARSVPIVPPIDFQQGGQGSMGQSLAAACRVRAEDLNSDASKNAKQRFGRGRDFQWWRRRRPPSWKRDAQTGPGGSSQESLWPW